MVENENLPSRIREIDGSTITSLAAFRAATGGELEKVQFVKGGDFSGWDFSKTRLRSVCFIGSDLSGANFSSAFGVGAGFVKANLTGANFQRAEMPSVLFRDANLADVNARNADFQGGYFASGWFDGAVAGWNLDGANMYGFVFDCGITLSDGCPVYQGGKPISAKGTNFTAATLHSYGLYHADLEGAVLDRTVIGPRQLPYLRRAKFAGDLILRGGDNDVRVTALEVSELIDQMGNQEVVDANPSFDCSDARSKVEEEICGEYADDLRLMDREIADLYTRAKAKNPKVRASQLAWLRERNQCIAQEYAADCIRQSYDARKGTLLGLVGDDKWLAPGEDALFVGEVMELPGEFKGSTLFKKIAPALAGASLTQIYISRDNDGLYSVEGSAVGANAHLCSLSASNLSFDKSTGWYVVANDGPKIPIFRLFDGRLEIFKSGKPDYKTYPEASDFMSCGARASFSDTRRIAVDAATMTRFRDDLSAAR